MQFHQTLIRIVAHCESHEKKSLGVSIDDPRASLSFLIKMTFCIQMTSKELHEEIINDQIPSLLPAQ
jgi:hypothetical protein